MSGAPFARTAKATPVTLVTGVMPVFGAETAVITLGASSHDHAPGEACVACASVGDVRALLFNLGEAVRMGQAKGFSRVVVDARRVVNRQNVIDALTGKLPALGLRDHAVARNFYLEAVV